MRDVRLMNTSVRMENVYYYRGAVMEQRIVTVETTRQSANTTV